MSEEYERLFELPPDPPPEIRTHPALPDLAAKQPDFETFYRDTLAPVLKKLETARLAILEKRKNILLTGGVVVATSLAAGYWLDLIPLTIGICIATLLAMLILTPSAKTDLRAYYKTGVIGPLVKFALGQDAQYVEAGRIGPREFAMTGLWHVQPTDYVSEDFVGHRSDKTPFYFSEIRAIHVYHTGEGKNRRKVVVPLFTGVLFCADFNKHFSGRIVIKNADSDHLPAGRQIDLPEDPVFNKRFVVISDADPLQVRYLLTPAFMQRLLELDAKTGGKIEFSLVNDSIYVACYSKEDHFEVSGNSFLDPRQIQAMIERIQRFAGIVETLELNTRIWTKT